MPTPGASNGNGTLPRFDAQATKFSATNALQLSTLANAAYLNQTDAERVLAVLCGTAFSTTNTVRPVSRVYTFGQPRVGLFNFCDNYNQLLGSKTFRFVNREDLVPRVPFRGWDYADVGNMIHFDSSGIPVLESHQWRNFLSRSIEGFKEFFNISTNFNADVGDHDYRQYETLVATHQTELAALTFA